MKPFFIISFLLLFIALFISQQSKEAFLDDACSVNTNCTSCANASGCSWCPNASRCLSSRILKSTDPKCNQSNTISASFRCNTATKTETGPETNASNQVLFDFSLYKNRIKDKIPPPNAFTTEELEYSPETVMANTNQLRNDLKNLYTNLPDTIASSLEEQVQPMVKGILFDNYIIQ
jgi:hypothetical protein